MADKKKMSVAEMLAAARRADGGAAGPENPASGEGASAAQDSPSSSSLPAMELPADQPAIAPAASSEPAEKPKPAKGAGGGRPSVAEMMAMARAKKDAGSGDAPARSEVAKAPAEKPAATAKAKPAPAAKPAAAAASAATRDTASILAAARKKERPGPMTKAEAAAKAEASVVMAKPKVVAPPMPLKPDYAKPKPAAVAKPAAEESRRDFFGASLAVGFWALGAVSAFWTLLSVKFLFPNVLREPPSKFKVGPPDAFAPGQVQEKFKAQYGIWVVNSEYNGQQQIVALKSVCTHLGCTPNWLEAEQKYKCPCHGSGFYKDGINFEGPAPRPLERYAIRLADDGQIEVDKSRTFQEEMGAWSDPSCFIPV